MTLGEWLREYRQRRRRNLGTDSAFEKHMRILFQVSRYVKLQGWKMADLETELEALRGQAIPEPMPPRVRVVADARVPKRPIVALSEARQPSDGRSWREAPSWQNEESDFDINGPICPDCGEALPSWRKCGRCGLCGPRHRRKMARERKRRERRRQREKMLP